jgi:hypothetical protein
MDGGMYGKMTRGTDGGIGGEIDRMKDGPIGRELDGNIDRRDAQRDRQIKDWRGGLKG